MATYLPGVRNLDSAEARQRRNGGWVGLALTVLGGGALAWFHVATSWRALLFFPALMASIGFLQARTRFCVMVALSSRSPATRAADRAKDRTHAFRMLTLASLMAAVVAGAACFA